MLHCCKKKPQNLVDINCKILCKKKHNTPSSLIYNFAITKQQYLVLKKKTNLLPTLVQTTKINVYQY